ncbi:MAG: ribosomal-processing cysteine protease Prp [Spirochaetaceae bacterium]|jgi:uncharacterized protein YsxB (DUF464 family)|nr:ribosomal-processing cysteine protease Prp [Spirochaetaceae bacterium]
MIGIDAAFDEAGLLRSCEVRGHAGAGPAGYDIVCAAVSILTRTAFRVLSGREGITLRGGAPDRGVFRMETGYQETGREFLAACGAFLMDGLSSVAGMYPEHVKLTIRRA